MAVLKYLIVSSFASVINQKLHLKSRVYSHRYNIPIDSLVNVFNNIFGMSINKLSPTKNVGLNQDFGCLICYTAFSSSNNLLV